MTLSNMCNALCSVTLLSCNVINVNNITSITFTSGKQVAAIDSTMSMFELCRDGNLKGAKAALKSGTDVNTKNDYGQTGLMKAVFNNHNSVVALILSTTNIDVNQKDNKGRSALHFADQWKNNETLKLLLNVPSIDVVQCIRLFCMEATLRS